VGLGSFDRDVATGSQPRGNQSRTMYPTVNGSGGGAGRNSAAVDATTTSAFETHALISPAATTDGAILLTAPNALGDHGRGPVGVQITTRSESGYEEFVKPAIDRILACALLILC